MKIVITGSNGLLGQKLIVLNPQSNKYHDGVEAKLTQHQV